ncbi:MAG: DsbA family protein [Roseiflexaceae bacterium]|nr:DsbA family protein [Roseiflexaceae bacterium]
MSTRSQRGRPAPTRKQSSLLPLYLLGGVVAVIAIALIALSVFGGGANSSGNAAVNTATLGTYPSKGSADAPVTVVKYSDFQCPGCAAYATGEGKLIQRDYIDTGKVHFIYHEMPLRQHALAVTSAEAARASGEQGKYWEMHDLLFARQQEWSGLGLAQARIRFSEYATELGLDTAAFNSVLESGKYRAALETAYNESTTAQIPSTPSFVIDGKIYKQTELRPAIDAALAGQ